MWFDPTLWGTVAAWVGALLSGLSILTGVAYYVFDRQRERRSQAGSVLVWLHPFEHGPPTIKIHNLSGKPIFDHGCVIVSRSQSQIARLARQGWMNSGPFEWPADNSFAFHDRHTFLNFHDGSELYLADGQATEHSPELKFNPAVYDYYVSFRDISGQYWVVDARTQKPVSARRRRSLNACRAGLNAN